MVWKKVDNADAGDADHFGGNDLDKVSDLFSGVDVDDVTIASDWVFSSGPKADSYIDLKAITVPASPAAGYIRLFIDSADGKAKIKRSNGDVVIIE